MGQILGKSIMMPPISGKSTAEKQFPIVLDLESYINFSIVVQDTVLGPIAPTDRSTEKGAQEIKNRSTGRSYLVRRDNAQGLSYVRNFEAEGDFSSLWFRALVPLLSAGLLTSRFVTFNLVAPQNCALVYYWLKGMLQFEQRRIRQTESDPAAAEPPLVSITTVLPGTLDERMGSDEGRRKHKITRQVDEGAFTGQHHGYSWTFNANLMYYGLASLLRKDGLHVLEEDVLVQALTEMASECEFKRKGKTLEQLISRNHHGYIIASDERNNLKRTFVLVEVLPRTWALFEEEGEDRPSGSSHPERLHGIYRHLEETCSQQKTMKLFLDPWTSRAAEFAEIHVGLDEAIFKQGWVSDRFDNCLYGSVSKPFGYYSNYIPQLLTGYPTKNNSSGKPSSRALPRRCVLVYYGTFAPFHSGHLETLELARDFLEADGWNVEGAYVTPSRVVSRDRKEHYLQGLEAWSTRAAIAQLCIAHLEWAAIDFAQGETTEQCVASVARRVDNDVSIFWVNGIDIPLKDRVKKVLFDVPSSFLLLIPRNGEDITERRRRLRAQLEEAAPPLNEDRVIVADNSIPKLQTSAKMIREMIATRRYEKASMLIGNDMAASYAFWCCDEGQKSTNVDNVPLESRLRSNLLTSVGGPSASNI